MISSLAEKLERKLSYFTKTIEDEAAAEQNEILSKSEKTHSKATLETFESIKHRNKVMLKAKQEELNRTSNRQIAEAKVKAMRGLVETRVEEIDKLFVNITALLAKFTLTAEYESYLVENINMKKTRANFTRVLLSPYDMRLEDKIKTATGLNIEPGREDYIGGFILLDKNHTIRDDCTFKTVLECRRDNFSYFL